jgi:hypothetical protein
MQGERLLVAQGDASRTGNESLGTSLVARALGKQTVANSQGGAVRVRLHEPPGLLYFALSTSERQACFGGRK